MLRQERFLQSLRGRVGLLLEVLGRRRRGQGVRMRIFVCVTACCGRCHGAGSKAYSLYTVSCSGLLLSSYHQTTRPHWPDLDRREAVPRECLLMAKSYRCELLIGTKNLGAKKPAEAGFLRKLDRHRATAQSTKEVP